AAAAAAAAELRELLLARGHELREVLALDAGQEPLEVRRIHINADLLEGRRHVGGRRAVVAAHDEHQIGRHVLHRLRVATSVAVWSRRAEPNVFKPVTDKKSSFGEPRCQACGVVRELRWPAKSHKPMPPDAMGASPCVFVSDPSGCKTLGILS
ncbi:unnamed protein product, partial [Pelagomonas calceolata]